MDAYGECATVAVATVAAAIVVDALRSLRPYSATSAETHTAQAVALHAAAVGISSPTMSSVNHAAAHRQSWDQLVAAEEDCARIDSSASGSQRWRRSAGRRAWEA